MVTVLKTQTGTQFLSANTRKTIQSIKEIVGNYSDVEIFNALRESNMDPNETAQKLLNQDPFHLVKRKRDKKKEYAGYKGSSEPRKPTEHVGQRERFYNSDHNPRRGGYSRSSTYGNGREFRVVRDNRVNHVSDKLTNPLRAEGSSSSDIQRISRSFDKRSNGVSNYHKHFGGRYVQQNSTSNFRPKPARDIYSNSNPKRSANPSAVSEAPPTASESPSRLHSVSSSNVVGVYAASDPVHVPSDSRSSSSIGPIKRNVGVVGPRQISSESTSKRESQQSSSNSTSNFRTSSPVDSLQLISEVSKNDQLSPSGNRVPYSNHGGGRQHQQPVGHQKGTLQSKEWKPKANQKSSSGNAGAIRTLSNSVIETADNSKHPETESDQLQDKFSQVKIGESQVIIAEHIRVPENDRCKLTFGTFGAELDSSGISDTVFRASEHCEESLDPAARVDMSGNEEENSLDDQVRNSGSSTNSSGVSSENQLADSKDSSSAPHIEGYPDISLVCKDSPSFMASDSYQHQDSSELTNFPAYDLHTGYDAPYFRPSMDDAVQGQGLPSPHEALSSHVANAVPASSASTIQHPSVAQMYPQVHVSHYANVMPYRQFLSPVYVPPMGHAYPHLSNGSSYVLMPGGGSHLAPNNVKYGVQPFKPMPAGSPTGFGNFGGATGYAVNGPGVVGGATGLDDSSRVKYKDGNLYVPNRQAESPELWIQNPRDLPGMQSTPYYNMQGQTPHPATYLPSHHSGHHHASFNTAQSSHMQFPGVFHHQQPPAIPNAHHMGGGAMGGNVGVGVASIAPGAQVGAYQQPQLGHLNWNTTNF